jgi:hypothetical protein
MAPLTLLAALLLLLIPVEALVAQARGRDTPQPRARDVHLEPDHETVGSNTVTITIIR